MPMLTINFTTTAEQMGGSLSSLLPGQCWKPVGTPGQEFKNTRIMVTSGAPPTLGAPPGRGVRGAVATALVPLLPHLSLQGIVSPLPNPGLSPSWENKFQMVLGTLKVESD